MSLKTYIAWNRTLKIILLIHQCEQKQLKKKKMLKILAKQQLQRIHIQCATKNLKIIN